MRRREIRSLDATDQHVATQPRVQHLERGQTRLRDGSAADAAMRRGSRQRRPDGVASFGQESEPRASRLGDRSSEHADLRAGDVPLGQARRAGRAAARPTSSIFATRSCSTPGAMPSSAAENACGTGLPATSSAAFSTAARCCAMPKPLLVRLTATGNSSSCGCALISATCVPRRVAPLRIRCAMIGTSLRRFEPTTSTADACSRSAMLQPSVGAIGSAAWSRKSIRRSRWSTFSLPRPRATRAAR